MKSIILGGMAAGALTVLLCTSAAGQAFQRMVMKVTPKAVHNHLGYLLGCTFCTSWWISLAMLDRFTITEWAATVAVANITVLLIHWGLSTTEEDPWVGSENEDD